MIFIITFFALYFFLEAIHDFYVITGNSKGWHSVSATQAVLVIFFVTFLAVSPNDIPYTAEKVAKIILWGLLLRFIFLDNFLNVLRGKGLFYVGETAWMDRMARVIERHTKIHCEILILSVKVALFTILIIY